MKFNIGKLLRFMHRNINPVEDRGPKGVDGRIIDYTEKNSKVYEQYRMLQMHLTGLKSDKKIKSIMLTSSTEGEGKSITACNLATAIACDSDKKVVLVDCDLRKSSVHTLFNIKKTPGVSDILEGKCKISDSIKPSSIKNLFLIPAGTEVCHPSDILRHHTMKDLLESLKASFDYVIIDTPPTLPISDSRIIGHLCDAVLLVVKFDKTSKRSLKEAFSLLKIAHAAPIASVLVDFWTPAYNYTRYSKYPYGEQTKEQ